MSFTKLGVVLPLGTADDFDNYYASAPAVLERNGVTWIYYTGWGWGGHDHIGLAMSKDGIHFTKLGTVLSPGDSGEFDDVDAFYPTVLEHDGIIYLYYQGYDGSKIRIGLAISKDGIHFNKLGVVIPIGADGDFDDNYLTNPTVLECNGSIYLYYLGHHGIERRIGLAVSEDGIHFTKLGVVVPLGMGDEFDSAEVNCPAVLAQNDTVRMYYNAFYRGYRIGLAVSEDRIHFTKLGVVLPLGAGGNFDAGSVDTPAAFERDGRVQLYYSGYYGAKFRIGLAISEDGL